MSQNYALHFYLKKPKNYVCGTKPIYMRITLAGEPMEISTGRECDPRGGTPRPTVPRERKKKSVT